VEVVTADVDSLHFVVGHFDAGRIEIGVDLAVHLQASVSGGGGDQLDDDLVADEEPSAPILRDE